MHFDKGILFYIANHQHVSDVLTTIMRCLNEY